MGYIDEIGATDGRWTCWAQDHGHNAHEIPYPGEVALLRDIRQAVGPEIVLYTEYPPAEVSRQYRNGEPHLPGMDVPSLAFLRRAIEVQCAHRQAFASHDVQPLVTTDVAGVFANRFSAPGENVWTIYNANGRCVRVPVLRVKQVVGAVYEDAWTGHTRTPKIEGERAALAVELRPKGIGCVTQELP